MNQQSINILNNLSMVTLRSTQIPDLDYVLAAESSPENSPYIGQWPREQHIDLFSQADAAH